MNSQFGGRPQTSCAKLSHNVRVRICTDRHLSVCGDAGCCLVQFDSPRCVLMFRRNFCLHFVPEHGGKNFPQMAIPCTRMHCVMLPCHLFSGYLYRLAAAGNIQFSILQRPQNLCNLFTILRRHKLDHCAVCSLGDILPLWRHGLESRSVRVGFVANKLVARQVYLQKLFGPPLSAPSTNPPHSLISHQTCVIIAVDSIVKQHTLYNCRSKCFSITKYKQKCFDCRTVS